MTEKTFLRLLVPLSKLTAGEREAFLDHYYLGQSCRQIARRQGISHPTIAKQLRASLATIRRELV